MPNQCILEQIYLKHDVDVEPLGRLAPAFTLDIDTHYLGCRTW